MSCLTHPARHVQRQHFPGGRRVRLTACHAKGVSLAPAIRHHACRSPAGAEPSYKFGVVHLYAETGVPCLPIALNSGLYWPRRSIMRYPGTIRVDILDPIPPGLDKETFAARLRSTIEEATAQLIAEGERDLAARGIKLTARRRGSRRHAGARPKDAARSRDSRAPRAP